MTNLNTLLDDLAAKAEAANTQHYPKVDECGGVFGAALSSMCDWSDAVHIAANSPAVTLALIEVARASVRLDEANVHGYNYDTTRLTEATNALQAALEENRG